MFYKKAEKTKNERNNEELENACINERGAGRPDEAWARGSETDVSAIMSDLLKQMEASMWINAQGPEYTRSAYTKISDAGTTDAEILRAAIHILSIHGALAMELSLTGTPPARTVEANGPEAVEAFNTLSSQMTTEEIQWAAEKVCSQVIEAITTMVTLLRGAGEEGQLVVKVVKAKGDEDARTNA